MIWSLVDRRTKVSLKYLHSAWARSEERGMGIDNRYLSSPTQCPAMDPSGQHWCTEQAVNFLSSVVHWQSGIKLYFIIYQKLCSVRWFQYQISFRKQFIFLENWFLFTLEQQMIMLFLMIYFYKQNKRWTLGCKWFCQSPFPAVRTLNRFIFNWCPRYKVNISNKYSFWEIFWFLWLPLQPMAKK